MKKLNMYFTGIGFWIGAGVFSIINIIKILTHANILNYDYIMTSVAVIFIIVSVILLQKKIKEGNWNTRYQFGIGFWIGGGIYSLINLIMNLKNAPQNEILIYNYLITAVAVIGLILNFFLLRKERNK